MEPGSRQLLSAIDVTKTYGATRTLRGAALKIYRGEVHAVLGENGAGKSTLVKVLVSAVRPDDVRIVLDGEPVRFRGAGDTVARGIVAIYQQLSLIPHLSVAENLFAFDLARGLGLRHADKRGRRYRARRALEAVGLCVDPETPAGGLPLAQRQLVKISRGVIRDCRVLILDEPTTTLNAAEIEHLFAVVRRLRSQGRGVLFISHRLDEVAAIVDRISVLRDRATVMDGVASSETTTEGIVHAMVGRFVTAAALSRTAQHEEVLRGERLTIQGAFADVDVSLRAGEVLVVVGLIGSGVAELGEKLAAARAEGGPRPNRRGTMLGEGR